MDRIINVYAGTLSLLRWLLGMGRDAKVRATVSMSDALKRGLRGVRVIFATFYFN